VICLRRVPCPCLWCAPCACSMLYRRAVSRLRSSHLYQAPVLTTPVSVPALPAATRMMAENGAGSDSVGSDREISRRYMPKCFGA